MPKAAAGGIFSFESSATILMGFAVETYFDGAADRRVRSLWQALASAGAGSYLQDVGAEPHVRLAIFDELDRTRALVALSRFSEFCEPLTLSFQGVDTFPAPERVVCLVPAPNDELGAFHAELHAVLRGMRLSSSLLYLPGRWVPHCTLAQQVPPGGFEAVAALAREVFHQFDATLCEIALVEFAPVKSLWRHRLAA